MSLHLRTTGCHLPYGITPATRRKWTHPALPTARGWYSTYISRRDGRLSWPRCPVTYRDGLPPTDGHPSKYKPDSARLGVELATCWSQVRCPNHYITKPPISDKWQQLTCKLFWLYCTTEIMLTSLTPTCMRFCTSVTLNRSSKYPHIPKRTKKYQPFISFALSKYQTS